MLTGLNHLTIAVHDVEKSFNFYVDILGFIPKAKWNQGAYLLLGDLWLCLSLDIVVISKNYTHYAFGIPPNQFEAFKTHLRSFKVIEWKDNKSEGNSIYFLDPDEHKLEVHDGNLTSRLDACKLNPYTNMEFF